MSHHFITEPKRLLTNCAVGIRIPPKLKSSAQVPHLDEREIEKAAQHSRRVIEENLKLERQLVEKGKLDDTFIGPL